MEKLYYKALTGSRLLGIHTDKSDIDFVIISTESAQYWASMRERGEDFFPRSPAKFIQEVFETTGVWNAWRIIGVLFTEPVVCTPFSEYLTANREQLVASNLKYFGDTVLKYCKKMSEQGNNTYPYGVIFPKRTIYCLIFLNAYIRYATEGIMFKDAFQIPSELKEFILGIRQGVIPYETQMQRLNEMLKNAEQVKEFYNKEPDLETFYRIKNEMKSLLDIN